MNNIKDRIKELVIIRDYVDLHPDDYVKVLELIDRRIEKLENKLLED